MQIDKMVFSFEQASDAYIDSFVKEFMEKNSQGINKLCHSVYGDFSKLSLLAFREIVYAELKKACYSFANNNHDPNFIESYLFACIHKVIKSINNEGKRNVYICPGCRYFSKLEILIPSPKKLSCNQCKTALGSAKEKWEEVFYKTFSEHSKKGYKCPSCDNFIPDTGVNEVSCPYPSCLFVGSVASMRPSRHPTIKANLEIPSLNDIAIDEYRMSDTEMMVKDDLEEYIKILNNCIDGQMQILHYKSNESTLVSKLCMYEAFKNTINKYPNDMISYLIFLNRNVRMQHKIFQEFVLILENKIPFSFNKNGKRFDVVSLLDENLCVFNGISEFNAVVDHKLEIPNLTEELYVGSRKGSYCRPYYIGKVLDITDLGSNEFITSQIRDHSFFKITMNDTVKPGTNVRVRHLRVPPHYQMGGMVYLNRIRRSIVDKVHFTIHGKKRIISR